MTGLFLPRQHVVLLLNIQRISSPAGLSTLAQPFLRICRNSLFALVRHFELEGSRDVSAYN